MSNTSINRAANTSPSLTPSGVVRSSFPIFTRRDVSASNPLLYTSTVAPAPHSWQFPRSRVRVHGK
jgi:hypothetical protein